MLKMNYPEIVKQINDMYIESNNQWFLSHTFPQIALYDLTRQNDQHT